jgi:aminobenzoyl-glutamate transport protein
MSDTPTSTLLRLLGAIERAGNRLPHPTLLFVWLCGLVLLLSAVGAVLGLHAQLPASGDTIHARNLLSGEGLRWMIGSAVTNFTGFAPVGTVLVAMLGIGVAEHAGLLRAVLTRLVLATTPALLSGVVVFAGILSNIAADAGYVVLIPLAALLFKAAGRPPLAGIAAAFAGVSAGYSASLIIGPVDALLAGITTEASRLVAPGYQASVAGNYYFMCASTLLLTAIGAWISERLVLPRLQRQAPASADQPAPAGDALTEASCGNERRALRAVALWTLLYIALLAVAALPTGAPLHGASAAGSPLLNGIVIIIALYAAVAGLIFGRVSGRYRDGGDMVTGMESAMAGMASYLVLMFFAAQFVSWFNWSQLGTLLAIAGAGWLQALQPGSVVLMLSLVLFAALVNLLIGSASAKWALLAPIFVPMFLLLGIAPEATQAAFRIGDSATNVITPLMPYFGVVVAFAQRWDKGAGIGTLVALMLPYSIAFLCGWSLLFALWIGLGWPLGPGVAATL